MSTDPQSLKHSAARVAAGLVQSGMTVGLGSGTTAAEVVRCLAERVQKEGLKLIGVPTSVTTATLARGLGIEIQDLDDVPSIDLNLDGADEVDPGYRLLKGHGGALLREKIVASAARHRVNVVTEEKLVAQLGSTMPVPVEVSHFGLAHTERRLRDLGAQTTVRLDGKGQMFVTDGGNLIIDCRFESIDDPRALDLRLHGVVGVFETGIFVDLCDEVVVARASGVRERPESEFQTAPPNPWRREQR